MTQNVVHNKVINFMCVLCSKYLNVQPTDVHSCTNSTQILRNDLESLRAQYLNYAPSLEPVGSIKCANGPQRDSEESMPHFRRQVL